ncbi:MAG: DUF374 domain-containing protein [Planctomycetes bacterium]|nr:DUF374 domain-containing protein [Planctomycetota bacterium]
MSVASTKDDYAIWKAWHRYRRFGTQGRRDFSVKQKLQHAGIATLGRLFVRACFDTCHWKIEGDAEFRQDVLNRRRQFIFVLWHNRLSGFFAWAARNAIRSTSFRIDSIISASKDGEFLARLIREGGGGEIRGSSSRDAARALRTAVIAAAEGANIASVGDGPRGPRYVLKPGPILLAKAAGIPILPFTWACNRTFQLHRSWDQLMVPLPFSTLRIRFGEPLFVPEDAGAREIVGLRRKLESSLNDLTDWADRNTRIRRQLPTPREGEVLKRRQSIELDERRL